MLNNPIFVKIGNMVRSDILEGRKDPYTEDEVMKMFGGFGKADKAFAPATSGSPMETGQCIAYVTDFLNGLTGKDVVANNTVFFGHEIAKTPIAQVNTIDELVVIVADKEENLSLPEIANGEIQGMVASLVATISGLDVQPALETA
jgi:hypothetical protein